MYQYLHSSSTFCYGGAAWSKDALSDERDGSLLLMPAGMFFVVGGGWWVVALAVDYHPFHPTKHSSKEPLCI